MPERCPVKSQFGDLCRMGEECAIKRFSRKWIDKTTSPESVLRNTERILEQIENNPDCLFYEENFIQYQKLNLEIRESISTKDTK